MQLSVDRVAVDAQRHGAALKSKQQAARRRRRRVLRRRATTTVTTTTTSNQPSNRRRELGARRRRRQEQRRRATTTVTTTTSPPKENTRRRRRRASGTTAVPTTTTSPPKENTRRRRRRARQSTPKPADCTKAPDKEFEGLCPVPCEAARKCSVCNTWNDIIKEFDFKNLAQFGRGFPESDWFLVASHQCHYFHRCNPVYDEFGDLDPENMPGGPFKDPKYGTVPLGHKCKGDPAKGWGNLGKCLSWKACFQQCLKKSGEAGKDEVDDQCNLVHYEVEPGRCTSFTTKECKDSDGKFSTTQTEGMVVMKAYYEDPTRVQG